MKSYYRILCIPAKLSHTTKAEVLFQTAERITTTLSQAVNGARTGKGSLVMAKTCLPVEEFGFTLHKGAFHDALITVNPCTCHQSVGPSSP